MSRSCRLAGWLAGWLAAAAAGWLAGWLAVALAGLSGKSPEGVKMVPGWI